MKKKFLGDDDIVPVIMFHSVGLHNFEWVFNYISEPLESFESKICELKSRGYNFIFWDDLYNHMSGLKKIKLPAVMLTFDDGYLDNWVYVYPILKKYNARGTIFVNPDFVDPGLVKRKTIEDVWDNKIGLHDLFTHGFLNWEEMRCMENSGHIDIQSHSLTHTWYFSSSRVLGFYFPGEQRFPWLAWNLRPNRKPYYLDEDQSDFVPLGQPIYEHEKSLICRRYYPSVEIDKRMEQYFLDNNIERYTQKSFERLLSIYLGYNDQFSHLGRYETYQEYIDRIHNELKESKRIIQEQLNKDVDFVCWPGGGYNKDVLKIARCVGYKAWTLSSSDEQHFRNKYCSEPGHIKRIGSIPALRAREHSLGLASGRDLFFAIKRHQGSMVYNYIDKINKIKKICTISI